MNSTKLFIILLASTFSTSTFAMLCPGNFNEINTGDSLATVKAACGAPTSENTTDSQANLPQEWVYYVSVNPAFYQNISQNGQASLKTTIAFANGKVTNMSVNGIGVSSTAICGNNIQIGDAQKSVEAACGKPAFINQGSGSQAGSQSAAKTTEITKLTYVVGGITTVLVFNNGALTARN